MQVTAITTTRTREDIIALPEWPGQRDTAKHLAKYLARPDFQRDHVTIGHGFAIIKWKGKEYRGNGNTRVAGFGAGKLDIPRKVGVTEFDVGDDFEAGQAVYLGFDNLGHMKGAPDRLTSALKANGLGVKSKFLSSGKGTTGIAIAWNAVRGVNSNAAYFDTEEMVALFKPEIALIDTLMASKNISTTQMVITSPGIQTAMLLTLHRARVDFALGSSKSATALKDAYHFWDEFMIHQGEPTSTNRLVASSPVIRLWDTTKSILLAATKHSLRSRKAWYEVGCKALDAFERRHAEIDRLGKTSQLVEEFYPYLAKKDAKAVAEIELVRVSKANSRKKSGKRARARAAAHPAH